MPAGSVPDVSQTTWHIPLGSLYSMGYEGNSSNNYSITVVAVEFIIEILLM